MRKSATSPSFIFAIARDVRTVFTGFRFSSTITMPGSMPARRRDRSPRRRARRRPPRLDPELPRDLRREVPERHAELRALVALRLRRPSLAPRDRLALVRPLRDRKLTCFFFFEATVRGPPCPGATSATVRVESPPDCTGFPFTSTMMSRAAPPAAPGRADDGLHERALLIRRQAEALREVAVRSVIDTPT